jgi:hypothetical protein
MLLGRCAVASIWFASLRKIIVNTSCEITNTAHSKQSLAKQELYKLSSYKHLALKGLYNPCKLL